jgi:hypothetical protein
MPKRRSKGSGGWIQKLAKNIPKQQPGTFHADKWTKRNDHDIFGRRSTTTNTSSKKTNLERKSTTTDVSYDDTHYEYYNHNEHDNNNLLLNEDECVTEFKAFARGGNYSIELLGKVWKNIMREYGVDQRRFTKLLRRAGLYQSSSGRIALSNPEDE